MRRLRHREGTAGPSPKGSKWRGWRAIPGHPWGHTSPVSTPLSWLWRAEPSLLRTCAKAMRENRPRWPESANPVSFRPQGSGISGGSSRGSGVRLGRGQISPGSSHKSRKEALATEHQHPGPWKSPRDLHLGPTLTPSSLSETTGKGSKFSEICIPWPLFLPHVTFKRMKNN